VASPRPSQIEVTPPTERSTQVSHATAYAHRRRSRAAHADALAATRVALTAEGFGVLCEVDVQATLAAKLGETRDPYVILGACNPQLAQRALELEPDLGVLLPCNVAVYVADGATVVCAVAADEMLGMVGNPAREPIAREVAERLDRVLMRACEADPARG